MAEPTTIREALAAHMLEEIDRLVGRVEDLPAKIAKIDIEINAAATALTRAGDNYRAAVTAFTDQAKIELTEHLHRNVAEIVLHTIEEHRAAMQDAAISAFQMQTAKQSNDLTILLRGATREIKRTIWARIAQTGIVALCAASGAAAAVWTLLH